MNFFVDNLYTVILIPLWIFLILVIGKMFAVIKSNRAVNALTILSSLYCLVFATGAFIKTFIQKGFASESVVPFITISKFNFTVGSYIDGVTTWFLLLAVIVSFIVQIYSFAYMKDDRNYLKFFAYLNFFNFSMFGLILSPNLFQMYIFWELVGVSSYLLIGFWFYKEDVSVASKKAFIINRIGDFSFLAGIILAAYIILSNLGNFASIALPFSEIGYISAQIFGCTSDGIFILTCILLLVASVAKSAQFPLHTWLIDAMKGPTPVSALIHSATMVAAGVFLLIRLYPLYSLSPVILNIITVIGLLTAIFCSYSALTQTDIKKVLAYSTSAQLGLMFLAVGSCSATVSLFHLTSHAFAKAMLFLIAGSVIHILSSNQDITLAGGLRKKFPILAYTFLIGIFSLSGILFSGFSSKEIIVMNLFESKSYILLALFVLVGFMTAYYLFRLYFYIFEGKSNFEKSNQPHKILEYSPALLAVFVVFLWFVLPKSENILLVILNYIITIISVALAGFAYYCRNKIKKVFLLYGISYNGFYAENLISFIVILYKKLSNIVNMIEKYIFEGVSYLLTLVVKIISLCFSKMQTGNAQSYLSYSLFIMMCSFAGILLVYSLIIYFSEVQ